MPAETKHTPGPWSVREDASREYHIVTQTSHIAEVDGRDDYVSDEELLANANLIAAAPDLLAACREAIVAIAPHAYHREMLRGPEADLVRTLDAAIAKAGGATGAGDGGGAK